MAEQSDLGQMTAGIVGTGTLGRETALRLEKLDVDVVAAADGFGGEAFADEFDVPVYDDHQRLLEDDLDLYFVANAHSAHYPVAKDILESGKPVHVEKPLTLKREHSAELVQYAEEHDIPLAVGFQRHFVPAFQKAKEIVERGDLGDIYAVESEVNQNWLDTQNGTWRTNPCISGGGNLFDSGTHGIDAALWITGSRPTAVRSADMDYVNSTEIEGGHTGIERAAYIDAVLDRNGDTVDATITVRGEVPDNGQPMYVNKSCDDREQVWFEQIAVRGTAADLVYWHTVHRWDDEYVEDSSIGIHYDDGFQPVAVENDVDDLYEKIADFVHAVENGDTPTVTGRDGAYVTAIVDAAYESDARQRAATQLDPRISLELDTADSAAQYNR